MNAHVAAEGLPKTEAVGAIGVVAALPAELGWLRGGEDFGRLRGLSMRISAAPAGGPPYVTALCGVGKVRAARAAGALVDQGVSALLVVGTAGALEPGQGIGALYLAREAVQWDLAVRTGRRIPAGNGVNAAWSEAAPEAESAVFLTADRPVLGPLERSRRGARARKGLEIERGTPLVADMETAAVAAVAEAAGVPWAALRVVSDRPPRLHESFPRARRRRLSFQANFARVAALPAETLRALETSRLAAPG